ncbi:amylosucrase [Yoonia litorea]|uniref:Amylosucrase n=1 Tax=Yoonia litorea TaxID=1123755 RepID=A0A1I6MMG5_9RHOB|nr:amylosucrase [Yoonia litorea]SFS16841.1 amylosucrase [Yoonia litorea]
MTGDISGNSLFELRLERSAEDLWPMLETLYGVRDDFDAFKSDLLNALKSSWQRRSRALKLRDLKRDLQPDWFQRAEMVGYACYADRFAGGIGQISGKLPYLKSLGVNYLHIMPCLKPRPRPNDGGYSVMDYRKINPELGTMQDLEALTAEMRDADMSLCIDLVLNHTAREHEWAQKALAGDPYYRDFYHFFDDNSTPRAYERTLVEIFPNDAPGNFTYLTEHDRWVWTTFNDHQWDLNWSNPWVFLEIVKVMLFLANKGVDILRLDAVAFMWKRMGTRCQSEPEVHLLLRALRAATRIAAPAVIHLEEAIVGPAEMLTYLGRGEHEGREGNLAYHNNLMVHYWSALATRDTRLMTKVLSENFPETLPNATYTTYLRCHDDIGWAITDEDAGAMGFSGQAHREFLSRFYAGDFAGSFASGAYFQVNEETGDSRISGTLAALAGLEKSQAEDDERGVALAIHRILMGNALIASFGGIPLIYMGDEAALLNDHSYRDDPFRADDSRWLHRPVMDWTRVENAESSDGPEGQILSGTRQIMLRRKNTPQFHAAIPTRILFPEVPQVFAFCRFAPTGPVICLFNFSEETVTLRADWLRDQGVSRFEDLLSGHQMQLDGPDYHLLPYGRVWAV